MQIGKLFRILDKRALNHVDAVDGSEYLDTELRPGAASAALADPVTRPDPDRRGRAALRRESN